MDTTARTRGGRWLVAPALVLAGLAGCGNGDVIPSDDPNARGRIDGGGGAGGSVIGSAGGSSGTGGATVPGSGGAISGAGGMVSFCSRRPYPCDTQTQICTQNNDGTGACLTQCSPCGAGMRCVGSGSCSTCAGTTVCSVDGAGGSTGTGGSLGGSGGTPTTGAGGAPAPQYAPCTPGYGWDPKSALACPAAMATLGGHLCRRCGVPARPANVPDCTLGGGDDLCVLSCDECTAQ